jgi:AcrR family transcriptional regulator
MLARTRPEGTPGVNPNASVRARALDAASDIVVNDGIDALTSRAIAHRAGIAESEVEELYASAEQLLADLLISEYRGMRRSIADGIERDPRGGLLSRVYRYSIIAIHERPLSRALYIQEPGSLNRIVRMTHGTEYFPPFGTDPEFLAELQRVGMIRADVDLDELGAFLRAYMAGTALISTAGDVDAIVAGGVLLIERGVDADVVDTEPGKRAFFENVERWERL